MSSAPAVGTPGSLAHTLSPAPIVPSLPSVSPSSNPWHPPGVNVLALLTSVPTSPTPFTSAPVTSSSSKQSQQPSSASQTTMSATTLATTSVPTLSGTSSTAPSTSAKASSEVSSVSSASSVITATSSSNDPSTTSTPETLIQPTTLLTTTASTTTQAQTLTSSIVTSELSKTTSTPTSTTPLTSKVQSTTTPSSSPVTSSSQGSSPADTDIPLTTVLESTTVYITGTNSQGRVVTSVPPVVTEVITTTGSGGIATTITQAVVNPTLASNNNYTGGSSFFTNTGAVVGVFVVVGLASASILMWMFFAIRRRQRMRRIEQDTVIEAAVAAAGFNRAPLDDADEGESPISPNARTQFPPGMDQRANFLGFGGSESLPTSTRLSDAPDDRTRGSANSHQGFPVERAGDHPEGYVPARTTSPPPPTAQFTDDLGSSRDRKSSYGHTPTYSAGSFEPLLATYVQNMPDQDAPVMERSQERSSQRLNNGPNGYSSDGSPAHHSRASLRRQNSSDSSVAQEDDCGHYVLMVRNIPDDQSQHSASINTHL